MPPLLQQHISDGSPARFTVADWFLRVERTYGISVRYEGTITSPSKTNKSLDERCRKYAVYLFFKRRHVLTEIEAQLSKTPIYDLTAALLCRILKEEYVRCFRELNGRTPTEPATSQEQVEAVVGIPLRLSQSVAPSLPHPGADAQPATRSCDRPSTPTEPDSDTGYQTAPVSPSTSAAIRSAARKRPSPVANQDNDERRKFSKVNVQPLTYEPIMPLEQRRSQITSFTTEAPTSQSFRSQNGVFTSFNTELTIPESAPPSSVLFGPTSSDKDVFSQLQRDILPSRDSLGGENSSLLYAASSNLKEAMDNTLMQFEQHDPPVEKPKPESHGLTEDYRVRRLPLAGFFFDDTHVNSHLPFHIQYECARIALDAGIQFSDCLDAVPEEQDYGTFWMAMNMLCQSVGRTCQRTPEKVWQAPCHKTGLTAKFHLTAKGKSLMRPLLMARDLQKHSRFHKKFGASRFLTAYLPDFRAIENDQGCSQLRSRLNEWLMTEKDFLGRQWRAVYVDAIKGKDNVNSKEEKFSYRVMFFAISGRDITPISLEECLSWFIDIHGSKNAKTSFCKIYSRIHLGFSNTQSGYMFHPHQVFEVPDIKASHDPEPVRFNDHSSRFNWVQYTGSDNTMNDGCSLISLGAAIEIWKNLGQIGPLPSVFQARINGAKGIWIRSADISTATRADKNIWVQINESQRKFAAHTEDLQNASESHSYEPLRWSFEVLSWSRTASPATLHQSFLPVLVDRGVAPQAIEQLISSSLDLGRQQILAAMQDPVKLRAWLAQNGGSTNQLDTSMTCGALPLGSAARAVMLLEHGFEPRNNLFLAELLYDICWYHFARVIKSFSVPLPQSTIVKGVADWTKTLLPGEIHLSFSKQFQTEELEGCHFLNGQEVLVTRHPCLRASDVQKVTARYAIELSHVRDVVVFSALGPQPLANKLQGGDYDGDDFWICWDPILAGPFKNAPTPVSSPDPVELGIDVDRRDLAQLYEASDQSPIDCFLAAAFRFSLQPSLLGLITDYYDRWAYKTNDLHDRRVSLLADLHGIVIDSTKNGYSYTKEQFLAWLNSHQIVEGQPNVIGLTDSHLPERAWKISIDSWDTSHRRAKAEQKNNVRDGKLTVLDQKPILRPNHCNILDRIHFKVIRPHVEQTIRQIELAYSPDQGLDSHLAQLFHDLLRDEEQYTAIREVIRLLRVRFEDLRQEWLRTSVSFEVKITMLHHQFMEIQPEERDDLPLVSRWLNDGIGYRPSTWTLLKASTLYSLYANHAMFVWHVAGDILCYIKAQHFPGTRSVVHSQYMNLKPKKCKREEDEHRIGEVVKIDDSSEFGSYQDDETEFFSISER